MEYQSCLKLIASGGFALATIASLTQPASACQDGSSNTNCGSSTTVVQSYPVPVSPAVYPALPSSCNRPGLPCQTPAAPPPPMMSDTFFCNRDRFGNPTTFVASSNTIVPLINWVSEYFTPSGYDPQVRCQDVSNRFDLYFRQGRLNYITTGMINDQPVICIADRVGGACTGLLVTLQRGEDPNQVIYQLASTLDGATDLLYQNESRPYFDVQSYMRWTRTISR